jgi:hypothetical protein
MSSTRDPILLLEPSNLLEPLDLADRHVDPASPSAQSDPNMSSPAGIARAQSAAAAIRRDATRGSQPIGRRSASERDGRWRLKSALLVAGALACVATGTALPQLPELMFGDAKPAQQTTKSAQQTTADTTKPKSALPTVADAAKPSARVADAPAKSEESKPAEPKPNESNGSNQSVALTANPGTQPAATDQPAPAAQDAATGAAPSCGPRNRASDDKCLEGGVPEAAAGTARTAVPDRSSDAPAAAPRTTAASPAKQRAAPQTIWELDDRPQQSINRRTTQQRATADPQATDDNDGQNARSSDRNASDRSSSDRNSWDRDRRQDQDSSRTSSRRRERSGDHGQTARYGDSRQEQDFNRNSGWRRDRYDEYARGEDRRVFGRAPRDDDRVIGVGPRHEGPLPMFPSLFGW